MRIYLYYFFFQNLVDYYPVVWGGRGRGRGEERAASKIFEIGHDPKTVGKH